MLAALAPPVHLSGERLGWTMLICMVSDFRRGRLEVSWKSALQGHAPSFPTSLALSSKRRGAVAIITVATGDWPSYSCSVSHRRHQKRHKKWHTASSGRSSADQCGRSASFNLCEMYFQLNMLLTLIYKFFLNPLGKACTEYKGASIQGNFMFTHISDSC